MMALAVNKGFPIALIILMLAADSLSAVTARQ